MARFLFLTAVLGFLPLPLCRPALFLELPGGFALGSLARFLFLATALGFQPLSLCRLAFLLGLPRCLALGSTACLLFLAPALGFLPDPLLLLGNRGAYFAQRGHDQFVVGAGPLEQRDGGISVTVRKQLARSLDHLGRDPVARFLPSSFLGSDPQLGDAMSHRGNPLIGDDRAWPRPRHARTLGPARRPR